MVSMFSLHRVNSRYFAPASAPPSRPRLRKIGGWPSPRFPPRPPPLLRLLGRPPPCCCACPLLPPPSAANSRMAVSLPPSPT
eukprot:55261-Prorocentrum_minimum.AAC.1